MHPNHWYNLFLLFAFIFFLLDGFRVNSAKFNWTALGFASVAAWLLFPAVFV